MCLLKNIFPLTLLLLLMSCGEKQTSTRLEVSSSYISASSFPGGLMIVGESATGKKFSLALNGADQGRILLDSDKWTFSAVGWSGPELLNGTPNCGVLKDFSLSSENSIVKIEISPNNCTANFNLNNNFNIYGCDVFNTYNSGTDAYSTSTVPDSEINTFCQPSNMPVEYISKFSHYRIQALNTIGNVPKGIGFESSCKLINDPAVVSMKLPAMKFPFIVNLYKSSGECTNKRKFQSYIFPNGFSSGNPSFDSKLSGTGEKLLLATSRTKRGTSPFMAEIPRIRCGVHGSYSDCFKEPTLDTNVNVPFYDLFYDRQTILKDLTSIDQTCSPSLMPRSKYFGAEDCKIENGILRIKTFRNALTCQGDMYITAGNTVLDMHRKGEFIYVLREKSGSPNKNWLAIYNKKGKLLHDFNLGNISATQVAASDDGKKIIVLAGSYVNFYIFSGSSLTDLPGAGASGTDIELSSDGNHYFVANASAISSYGWNSSTLTPAINTFMSVTNDMRTVGNELYFLDGLNFKKNSYTTNGSFSTTSPTQLFTVETGVTKFEIVEGRYYFLDTTNKKYYNLNPTTLNYDPIIPSPALAFSSSMTIINDDQIAISDGHQIHAYKIGETSDIAVRDSICSESLDINSTTITFKSDQKYVVPAFNNLFRIVGLRFTDPQKPSYFVESLSEYDEGSGGGELRPIQEMLGPEALGAFLSEYPTCEDVKSAATTAAIVKKLYFKDELTEKSIAFNLTVSAIAATNDLIITFTRIDGIEIEKMNIKLTCGTQKGSFESYHVENNGIISTRRELLIYNTTSDTTSNYEKYSHEKKDIIRAEITKFEKSNENNFFARSVGMELKNIASANSELTATVTEIELGSSEIKSSTYRLSDQFLSFFTNTSSTPDAVLGGSNFSNLKTYESFTTSGLTYAQYCMPPTTYAPFTSVNDSYCALGSPNWQGLSKDLNLSPSGVHVSGSSFLLQSGTGSGVFEITP